MIFTEIGPDFSRFPTAAAFCSGLRLHRFSGAGAPNPGPQARETLRAGNRPPALARGVCSLGEPASASPAGIYAAPTGRNSRPPPRGGWGIFNRRFGEFSTGVDNPLARWTGPRIGLGANATWQRAQSVNSLNPRPLKIIGTHLSARAARVFACFAPET
jgi:hypothetical protein